MARNRSLLDGVRPKPAKTDKSPAQATVQPTIVFTGNRRNDHYEVIVHGQIVELPLACLRVLIGLVVARAEPGHGFVRLNPVTVHRLRQAIDHALGDGAGKALIETGTADEYRVITPTDELQGNVVLAPCFSELVQVGVVSAEVGADLERSVK